jgi:molybdate transport system substrate-binding protein
MSRRRTAVTALVLALVGLNGAVAGCGSGDGAGSAGGRSTLTVFAAASLTEAFTTLGRQFEAAHRGVTVRFSFGPSSGLAAQIQQGAPADVFASAAESDMDRVAADVAGRTDFVSNTLEIAVPRDNPGHVGALADLARPSVTVAVCQAEVPCGVVAAAVFRNAGLTVQPVTEEADVKSVLAKVTLGEVDAGLVYVSDIKAAGDKVHGIAIPADVNAVTTYPIAEVKSSEHATLAEAFVDLVLSDTGQQVLAGAGFAAP